MTTTINETAKQTLPEVLATLEARFSALAAGWQPKVEALKESQLAIMGCHQALAELGVARLTAGDPRKRDEARLLLGSAERMAGLRPKGFQVVVAITPKDEAIATAEWRQRINAALEGS
jgi:hypothetical protein